MLDPKTFSVSLPPFPLCFFPRQKVKKKKERSGGHGSGKEEREQKIANL